MNAAQSTALEVVRPQQVMPAPPVYFPLAELEQMAEHIAKSGLFGMKTKEQAMALMLTAQAEGQHPATIVQDYDIFQGKPNRKTNSVLARFQAAGGKLEWVEFTQTRVAGLFSHPTGHPKPLEVEWTIEMAKTAGLLGKDNWKGYPRAMLRARCIAEGVRATYPAAIGGMLIREEAEDLGVALIDGATGNVVAQPKSKSRAGAEAKTVDSGATEKAQAEQQQQSSEGPKASTAPTTEGGLTAGMLKTIRARLVAAQEAVGLTEEKVCERFEVKALEEIPAARVNDVLGFVANPG